MSWSHNPVAAVALCLLTQQYRLSSDLLSQFGNIDVSVELLTEVDKLVQLLESPIFICEFSFTLYLILEFDLKVYKITGRLRWLVDFLQKRRQKIIRIK